jgi:outer membrane protein OmpA-like peptidoglycan-associated protein
MSQKGKCTNHAGCVLAYRGEEITVTAGPFVCPECGSPLQSATVATPAGGKNLFLSGAAGLILLVALSAIVLCRPKQEPAAKTPEPETPAAVSGAVPATSVPSAPAAPSAPAGEPPVARAVPAGQPLPPDAPVARAVPAAPPAPPAAVPAGAESVAPPVAAAQPDLDLNRSENRNVKTEVLKRIDLMPTISADNKDRLYMSVERARQMGRLLTIPFGSGRSAIGGQDVEALKAQLALPQVRALLDDPTAVFVILGFADTKGNEQKNLAISEERAKHVLNVLRDRCGVLNVMHSVGMGGSTLFDPSGTEKNRVAEVWVVLP